MKFNRGHNHKGQSHSPSKVGPAPTSALQLLRVVDLADFSSLGHRREAQQLQASSMKESRSGAINGQEIMHIIRNFKNNDISQYFQRVQKLPLKPVADHLARTQLSRQHLVPKVAKPMNYL